ncbi:MAG TPA: hypothetical protein VNT54_04945 [Solirubrobacteraceae bacterium]|nr:hypothetical protein [Solirubrobacteraceae bacterium]
MFNGEIADRRGRPRTPRSRLPLALGILHEPALAQVGQRVIRGHRYQTGHGASAHRHDHLSTIGSVADVAAELIVQFADADLTLERMLM